MSDVVDLRLLELRSGLFFEYPKLNRGDSNLLFFLPFWENPIISENKEARLVEYDVINRGSTLFSHTGASARNISIEFTLTLPHIMRSINSVLNSQILIKSLSTDVEKDRFNNKNPLFNNDESIQTTTAEETVSHWKELVLETNLGRYGDEFFHILEGGPGVSVLKNFLPEEEAGAAIRNINSSLLPINISHTALKAINSAVFILNIIRTCVAGNAVQSVLGPPTLRLRHGASYADVPLVCRDYAISVEEDAGYDLKTLLPHRIRITLNTSELRAGNFGRFKPGVFINRDNLAGWEAVIGTEDTPAKGTIDPGYLKR